MTNESTAANQPLLAPGPYSWTRFSQGDVHEFTIFDNATGETLASHVFTSSSAEAYQQADANFRFLAGAPLMFVALAELSYAVSRFSAAPLPAELKAALRSATSLIDHLEQHG